MRGMHPADLRDGVLRELLMHLVSTLDPTTVPATARWLTLGEHAIAGIREMICLCLALAIEGLGIHIALSDRRIDILIFT
ncbi:MAG TPA: hypothetical protein VFO36_01940 [Nitrospiraceae bacterium]|nr:hypothetical protein [Nitrospiraceae bacterium]